MSALAYHFREPGLMRRLSGWIPLLVCLLAITLTAPSAKANFVLEYTGAPFSNNGLDCNQSQCLTGSLTIDFVVEGIQPAPGQTFCLSLTSIGDANGDCLVVGVGWIRNGTTSIPIVGNPNNVASLQLGPSASYWLVYLDGLSSLNPSSKVLSSHSAFSGLSETLQLNDSTHANAIGRSNTPGTWSMTIAGAEQVPEPATWTVMAIGIGLVGLLQAKRKAAAGGVDLPDGGFPR